MEAKIENKSNTSLIENMFEVGAHFGYSRTRRHPSFKPLIFGAKNNVDIINLEKTGYFLNKALEFVKECARHNKTILFVGTKPEARRVIEEAAASLDLPDDLLLLCKRGILLFSHEHKYAHTLVLPSLFL